MSVKNINSLRYFLDRWEMVDPEYNYTVPYHDSVDPTFTSLPTFVAEFHECKVHSCPILVTRENNGKGLVHLLSQDPYQSSDLMCADDWHANNEGRALHTKNLYRSINDRLQLKK